MQSKSKADFKGTVQKIRSARNINVILCCIVLVAAMALAVFSTFTQYKLFGILTSLVVGVCAAGLLMKNMNEVTAAIAIAKNSVFAAAVSKEEMDFIRKHQLRRGQSFYFTAMLVVLVPVLYLNARLSVKHAVCLVSGKGVVIGREILPFNAAKGEALQLFRFSDYYSLKFAKSAVFGIKYPSDVIFPVDGALRAGLEGSCDEELAAALELGGVFATDDAFYESRDYLAEAEVDGDDETADNMMDEPTMEIDTDSLTPNLRDEEQTEKTDRLL